MMGAPFLRRIAAKADGVLARRRVQVSPRRQGKFRNGSPQKWNGVGRAPEAASARPGGRAARQGKHLQRAAAKMERAATKRERKGSAAAPRRYHDGGSVLATDRCKSGTG